MSTMLLRQYASVVRIVKGRSQIKDAYIEYYLNKCSPHTDKISEESTYRFAIEKRKRLYIDTIKACSEQAAWNEIYRKYRNCSSFKLIKVD